ncbi:MAG: PDZ domain-containing protein [Gemmatimonadota bacterium]|nr:PDZ domain-containing protein [Gemmatimonadota bacterium]MDH4350534.1 PDZ domain-containing protein [Gemmatimonadota bacterium]MDH5197607.1 PDZ domain-containing protein [Gemmatimonadota bacterium]
MRRLIIGVVALFMMSSGATAQDRKLTEAERRELEQKLEQVRKEMQAQQQQMRELERQLGRARREMVFVSPRTEAPLAFAMAMGRPRLGVIVKTDRDVTTDSIGAVVEGVTPDGPAAKAGLEAGDIVVTFDGKALGAKTGSAGERLIDLARELEEGDTVRVAIRRGKDAKTVVIVPEALDDLSYAYGFQMERTDSAMKAAQRAMERAMVVEPRLEMLREGNAWTVRIGQRWSDMELTTLDAELGTYFGATEGLLVVRAPKDGLLGLKSGDVIRRIGGRVPTSPSQATRIFRSYEPGDEIRIEIMRNKSPQEVKAIVPQPERGLFWEEKN